MVWKIRADRKNFFFTVIKFSFSFLAHFFLVTSYQIRWKFFFLFIVDCISSANFEKSLQWIADNINLKFFQYGPTCHERLVERSLNLQLKFETIMTNACGVQYRGRPWFTDLNKRFSLRTNVQHKIVGRHITENDNLESGTIICKINL